jgi:hypothetical protein
MPRRVDCPDLSPVHRGYALQALARAEALPGSRRLREERRAQTRALAERVEEKAEREWLLEDLPSIQAPTRDVARGRHVQIRRTRADGTTETWSSLRTTRNAWRAATRNAYLGNGEESK